MCSATSRIFAAEGAKVIIADVLDQDGENLAQELNGSAIFCLCNVCQVMLTLLSHFSRPQYLVVISES
jgi:NAD(P)-dependent dehydrogenase (short-subunit alcohol dehydrogenase family)